MRNQVMGQRQPHLWLCGLHLLFSLIMSSLVRHRTEKARNDAYGFENLNQTQGIIQ